MGCAHNASSYNEQGGVLGGKRVHGLSVGMMGKETEARSCYKPYIGDAHGFGSRKQKQDRLSDNLAP